MFNAILKFSIQHRYLVLIVTGLMVIASILSYSKLIIDAVPDITNVQVQINSQAQGYSPLEVEQRITAPLERSLLGIPGLEYTRSLSRYGLSQITAAFKDGTDIYFARQLISQRLQQSEELLPKDITTTMGPIATGLGEIFMFLVANASDGSGTKTLQELREIQDWIVKPQLRTVPGVVEINSIGGAAKEIVITPNLEKLRSFGFAMQDLSLAVARNNANVGAGFIEQQGEQFLLRVASQATNLDELREIVAGVHEGVPILLKDVAQVAIGSELRNGAATENGTEVVIGTVFMLMGENGRAVSELVEQKLKDIAPTLPAGVTLKPVYNRADLVNATIKTVRNNLFEGALLVIAILFAALGNARAALITACVIPLSMLITVFGMAHGRLSANLMSLGALDFGLIVDGAVILVENCIRRLGEAQSRIGRVLNKEERLQVVYEASSEVRQATMFGELIIMVVYVPILALSGIEGKMYHPMAMTVLLALGAAFLLSLTFVPAAVAIFINGKVKPHSALVDRTQNVYRSMLQTLIRRPVIVISLTAAFFLGSLFLFTRLGSEFIPALDEGDIALHALRIPGTSLTQAVQMQHHLEDVIKAVPEVSHVFAKIGTAEIATDPMPPSVADGYVILKPRAAWPNPKKPKHELVAEIESLVAHVPGNNYEFTQPIQMRFNELIAGVRSDVAIKIFGDDSEVLLEQAEKAQKLLQGIRGASDIKVEPVTGLPVIEIRPSRSKIARYGLHAADVQSVVRVAYAGEEVSRFYQGDRNFPITIRLGEADRKDREAIGSLPIRLPEELPHSHGVETERHQLATETAEASYVLLSDVTDIQLIEGPNQITRENGKRRVVITANVRDRDLGSFVEEAQRRIAADLQLPPSYWIGWGGQYENLISAQNRLLIIVPLVLLSVFSLIYFTFRSLSYSLVVFSGIPLALSGGILALWLRGIPFSISAAVGFIALCGVSVLNGLVMVSFIKRLISEGQERAVAIIDGAVARLRPVLMTALVASLGFIPMAISQGTGSEVQRPLATVVIGGIVSSTVLTLFVLPCLLILFSRKRPSTIPR